MSIENPNQQNRKQDDNKKEREFMAMPDGTVVASDSMSDAEKKKLRTHIIKTS